MTRPEATPDGASAPGLPEHAWQARLRPVVQWFLAPLFIVVLLAAPLGPVGFLLAVVLLIVFRLTRLVGNDYFLVAVSGCLVLPTVLFLVLLTSSLVLPVGLALAGATLWFLLARVARTRMPASRILAAGLAAIAAGTSLGFLLPVVPLLPCPPWCSRSIVKPADYRAMTRIFGRPLPASFRIRQVHYPGYSLVFNGPDGPLAASYEATVQRADFAALVALGQWEEFGARDGEWPAFAHESQFVLKDFGNDWPDRYDNARWNATERETEGIGVPRVYRVSCPTQGTRWSSIVTLDDRNPETLKVYLYTIVPYYSD